MTKAQVFKQLATAKSKSEKLAAIDFTNWTKADFQKIDAQLESIINDMRKVKQAMDQAIVD
ncbi:MAG: hypothetical protein AAF599_08860 [Bacteroidota bacterium]